ncbi:MAG: helix-turn-helix domain-containing protein [Nitrospirales bacterium]|nr:helix-turn-helix domain-containing protein [Nitrospirales bacterium]
MNRMTHIDNHLRVLRQQAGLSQTELARTIGVTRQAIYAIEMNHYLPSTDMALRLARVLGCQVEDLFHLDSAENVIYADFIGTVPEGSSAIRAQIARVGDRTIARPLADLGEILNYAVPADGLILRAGLESPSQRGQVKVQVQLLKSIQRIEETLIVGGCDPAIFLAGSHFSSTSKPPSVIGWSMGSVQAIDALKRGDVHIAGLHLVDPVTHDANISFLKKHLKPKAYTVVRFAAWEQGLMVRRGNPKAIRGLADSTRRNVRVVNREIGAAARFLFDQQLTMVGIRPDQVRGYGDLELSHLHVGKAIVEGRADMGIGVRSAALFFNLDFLPLQEEKYDLVIPTAFLTSHPSVAGFLDTLVSRTFQTEIDALGGYDIRDMGNVINWTKASS